MICSLNIAVYITTAVMPLLEALKQALGWLV